MNVIPPPPNQPPQYVFLIGNNDVAPGINMQDSILQILHWIGFRTVNLRDALVDDAFGSFEDIRLLSEKDISNMASEFASRTAQNGRIMIGTKRTKLMQALLHWTEDFYRVTEFPSIVGLNEHTFKSQLQRALARADIRKTLKDQTATAAAAADPGPLKSEKEWKQ